MASVKKAEKKQGVAPKKNDRKKRTGIIQATIYDIIDWKNRSKELGPVDLPFFFIVIILLVMGIIMMFSASYASAISEGEAGTFYAVKQIKFALGGLAVMFVLSKVDYHFFENKFIAFSLFGVCIVMLIVMHFDFLNLGVELNDSTRWIKIFGIQFQPSEIMKFSVVILFSLMITHNYKRMKEFKVGVLPYTILLVVVSGLMMLQPHLSGTIIICMLGFILMFIGGARMPHLLMVGLIGAAGLAVVVLIKIKVEGFSYFTTRFDAWKNPENDLLNGGWQTYQSLVAIGSGGIFGMGLGNSRQKFQYLPETENDFVFSILCEELGFVGAVTVIALFAFFVFRGFYIASKAPDKFGMLTCVGLTIQVGLQAFLNIAVVSNFIPNTGISLPFFSYGGTSIMMLLAQMGIVMNISRHAMADEPEYKKKISRNRQHRKVQKNEQPAEKYESVLAETTSERQ